MKRIAFGSATTSRKVDGKATDVPNVLTFATGTSPDNAPGSPTVKIKTSKGEKVVAAVSVPADALTYEEPETLEEIQLALGDNYGAVILRLVKAANQARVRSTVTGKFRTLDVLPADPAAFACDVAASLTTASLAEEPKRGGGKGRQSEASKALADIASALSAGASADDLRKMLAARGITL